MNKEWSVKNSEFQKLIKSRATYKDGIKKLTELRAELFGQVMQIADTYPPEAFYQMPFAGAEGYHSKTLAYSIWHIFRIEDITAHELLARDQQIFFSGNYQQRTGSPLITTGNELQGDEIAAFSEQLDIRSLAEYAREVMQSTNALIEKLEYPDLRRRFTDEDRQRLTASECVSTDENARWLIDYWCGKDIAGILKMPFSRHWIMHIEAMLRIKNKLCRLARKGVDPVAYCGLSCNHCFLSQWCGSCRTCYNVCSFATSSPDGKCQNAVCCHEKNIDGCYECPELEECTKGFYTTENDGAGAAKAQAMFIRKYGKKKFLKMQDRLHEKYVFQKTQEILGQEMYSGLRILEQVQPEE